MPDKEDFPGVLSHSTSILELSWASIAPLGQYCHRYFFLFFFLLYGVGRRLPQSTEYILHRESYNPIFEHRQISAAPRASCMTTWVPA